MKYIAMMFYDYGTPILIAVLLACLIAVFTVYGKKIRHETVMLVRWVKAYADAIRKTIREERNRSDKEKKLERIERKEERLRKKRDALQIEIFGDRIDRMMDKLE